MPRVNVEQKALTDPRFDLLGRFMESNRHESLGRMILVWSECLERSSYTLPERLVGAILGNRDGAQWLVESGLAEWQTKPAKKTEGVVRICGTEGRIEWLATKRKNARINGMKGGRPNNQPETDVGSATDTAGNQKLTPLTLTLGSKDKSAQDDQQPGARFSRFWKAYPRKAKKQDAEKAFAKLNPSEELLAEIFAALDRQKQTHDWMKENGRFIPYPAGWLRSEQWLDQPPEILNGKHEPAPPYKPLPNVPPMEFA